MAKRRAHTLRPDANGPAPKLAKVIEPKPAFIVNGAPVTATGLRPWTDAEKRLPLWLRAKILPRHVADPAEQVFLKDQLPAPVANLLAMIQLARSAEWGVLTVRRDYGTKSDAMDPAVFLRTVVTTLRFARDDVLKQTAVAFIPVVSARLDALIAATNTTLNALMNEQLDRILCDDPTCNNRGKHMLPGPWNDAIARSTEASVEAGLLTTFFDGDGGYAKPPALPYGADESASPALTVNQSRVLQTMAMFDASQLVSADAIAAQMDAARRLSARTIGPIVRKLMEMRLAERPEGGRSGARLTTAGRRLVSKIAD